MAEDFDLYESDLFSLAEDPELTVTEEQTVPDPSAEPTMSKEAPTPSSPARQRRRKRRRPKWQRLLWKYWPPVRFGLIILAGILIICLLLSSISGLFSGKQDPDSGKTSQTQETEDTSPLETTDPVQTSEPTEEPTEAPTPAPTVGVVDDSWYQNTLFIGDFGYAGLKSSARNPYADYFCSSNLGVFNYDDTMVSDTNFEEQDLASLLASKAYDKILINLGINNCGYPTSSLINAYTEMVSFIRQAQPNAKIIIQGILPVTRDYAKKADYFSVSHINEVNSQIKALADDVNVFYVEINSSFTESDGYLIASISTDGCHLRSSAYADWVQVLSHELALLGID